VTRTDGLGGRETGDGRRTGSTAGSELWGSWGTDEADSLQEGDEEVLPWSFSSLSLGNYLALGTSRHEGMFGNRCK
jgi:hypothetical protein